MADAPPRWSEQSNSRYRGFNAQSDRPWREGGYHNNENVGRTRGRGDSGYSHERGFSRGNRGDAGSSQWRGNFNNSEPPRGFYRGRGDNRPPRGRGGSGRGRIQGYRGRGAPQNISWEEWASDERSTNQMSQEVLQRRALHQTVENTLALTTALEELRVCEEPANPQVLRQINENSCFHPPLPSGNRASFERLLLLTNELPVELTPEQEVHRYAVSFVTAGGGRQPVNLLEADSDMAAVVRRNDLAISLITQALQMYGILSQNGAYVYDSAATLFVNESIDLALKPHSYSLTVSVEDLPPTARNLLLLGDDKKFTINLSPVNSTTVGDMMTAAKRGFCGDQALKQFLEILTNSSKNYAFVGQGIAVKRDGQKVVNRTQHSKDCCSKGVRFVTGKSESDDLCAVLNVDACKSVFYTECPLDEFMLKVLNVREAERIFWNKAKQQKLRAELRGLRVFTKDRSKTFTIVDVVRDPQSTQRANAETPTTKLVNWPVIAYLKRNSDDASISYMHADALVLAPFQKVQQSKLSEKTKPNSMVPKERWQAIKMHINALDLASASSTFTRFGVKVAHNFMKVEGYRRPVPKLSGQKGVPISINGDDGYFKPTFPLARSACIDMLYIIVDPMSSLRHNAAVDFSERLLKRAEEMNIKIINHELCSSDIKDEFAQGGNVFKKACIHKRRLSADSSSPHVVIMYIDDLTNKSHNLLKLAEVRFQIVTQHVTTQTVSRTNSKDTTLLSNVLLKLNVKMNGLNYLVIQEKILNKLVSSNTMIIGYDVWHPTNATVGDKALGRQGLPSVVGFSGNCGRSAHDYVGDYCYQNSLQEEVSEYAITINVQWLLRMWLKNRSKNFLPGTIIVFRDGISRGQYDMVVKKELPSLRKACAAFAHKMGVAEYAPKFVILVCTKRHNQRFAMQGSFKNTPRGTTIDQHVVHQNITEFFLQTHHPILGTTSIPKYQMLVSDVENLTQDELHQLIIALAYEHQISTCSISLPEPINQADEWANRGSNNLRQYLRLNMKTSENGDSIDFNFLSDRLSYKGKALEGIRVNA